MRTFRLNASTCAGNGGEGMKEFFKVIVIALIAVTVAFLLDFLSVIWPVIFG